MWPISMDQPRSIDSIARAILSLAAAAERKPAIKMVFTPLDRRRRTFSRNRRASSLAFSKQVGHVQ